MAALSCRFYANEFPEIEDTVMVKVQKIAEMGAYVTLYEYDNKEGMILLSELSRRRIRSVNKLIRVGRSECVVVIRVDKDKGYIDLSKRRVYPKDLILCEERFARAKAINSILRYVAEQLGYTKNEQLEELYDKTAWHFDRKMKKKAGAFEVFAKALTDSTVLDECEIEQKVKDKLLEEIRKKLTPRPLKIRSDIEVSCFAYEGIESVKKALLAGKQCSTEDMPIKINLIAAPLFVVTTQTMDREGGTEAIQRALDAIQSTVESHQGTFKIVMQPKVLTDLDEEEIKKRLELLEQELGSSEDEDEEGDGEKGEGGEEEEGMVAPKGLDQVADAAEEKRRKGREGGEDGKGRKEEKADEEEEDEDSE